MKDSFVKSKLASPPIQRRGQLKREINLTIMYKCIIIMGGICIIRKTPDLNPGPSSCNIFPTSYIVQINKMPIRTINVYIYSFHRVVGYVSVTFYSHIQFIRI